MLLVGLRELLSACIPRDHCRQTNSHQLLQDYISTGFLPTDVLDFGCGDGRSIDVFRKILPQSKWTGVDIEISPEVNERKRNDGHFVTYDGCTLPFPSESFDLVYSNQVMEHVRYPEVVLQEINRVLRNDGVFIGQTSQFEPYHSYSLWNFTIYGWKCIVEEAGLILRELRPSIDGFSLMERSYLGRPPEYNKYFNNESPKNLEIEASSILESKSVATINYRKLLWCGQFSFICVKNKLSKTDTKKPEEQLADNSLIFTQNNQATPEWLLNFISMRPKNKEACQTFLTAFNSYSLLETNKVKQMLETEPRLQQYVEYCLQHGNDETIEMTKKINIFVPSKAFSSEISSEQIDKLSIIYPIKDLNNFQPKRSFKEFDTKLEASYLNKAQYFYDDIITDNKLVSIIMPTYNRAAIIMKAINSVIQQSYSNWELLIVDDGSTDNTLEILELLTDNRIKVYKTQHQGVSAARNKGLENSKGEIIFYLDSDNEWTHHFIENMLIALMYSKNKCAYSAITILDDDNNILGYRGEAFNWIKCLEANYIDMNIFCHHRHLYEELGGFDESLKRMVDWDVILRYTKKYPPVYIPFIGCNYLNSQKDLFRVTITQPKSYKEIVQAKHKS